MVDDIVDVSVGYLPDTEFGQGTIDAARTFASQESTNWMATAIQGNTARELAARATVSITQSTDGAQVSLKVPVPEICSASVSQAQGQLELVKTAMDKGMSCIKSLTSIVGEGNGARDLLTASLDSAKKMAIAYLITKVMGAVNAVHPYSHPLFIAILQMTWSENQQWIPDFLAESIQGELGVNEADELPTWSECKQELSEFFDFVQEVMGGAIDAVWEGGKEMYQQVTKCCGGYNEEKIREAIRNGACKDFPTPPLKVPNMSIGKQMIDFQDKLQIIKEIVRQKAKMVLYKLRSLEGPDMSMVPPRDMMLVMEVLIEVEFIYQNLHIVIDKIVELIINMFVQKFAKLAKQIIDKVFDIWKMVIEIVPPLEDLLDMCWKVPNQADTCCNGALNLALPQVV